MPKTLKNKFKNKLKFENMYQAYIRAKKNKGNKKEVLEFEMNLEKNLIKIINDLKNNSYCIGKYTIFKVYEPKERLIKVLPFCDRVVHQWFVYEFLIPCFVPTFIYDSYACILGKGNHHAVERLKKFINEARKKHQNFYIIKMDISKFFYNVDQEILYSIIQRRIKDKYLLNLCKQFIFDKEKIGIPIGNYTSQYFANIYLNELDYYIKHFLRIKYYLRYMDDFIIIVENKNRAKYLFFNVENYINNNLKLKLNHKSRIYPSHMGVDFCGYRLFYTHVLIRNKSKKKITKKIKKWNYLYRINRLDKKQFILSWGSWKSYIKHSNSYNLYNKYKNKISFKI